MRSATASESFCFIPPESFPAGRASKGASPVAESISRARVLISPPGTPFMRPKKSRFSMQESSV